MQYHQTISNTDAEIWNCDWSATILKKEDDTDN